LLLVTVKTATLLQQLKLIDLFNLVAALEGLSSSSLAIICTLLAHTQRLLKAI
jgi:hypothetical protein